MDHSGKFDLTDRQIDPTGSQNWPKEINFSLSCQCAFLLLKDLWSLEKKVHRFWWCHFTTQENQEVVVSKWRLKKTWDNPRRNSLVITSLIGLNQTIEKSKFLGTFYSNLLFSVKLLSSQILCEIKPSNYVFWVDWKFK